MEHSRSWKHMGAEYHGYSSRHAARSRRCLEVIVAIFCVMLYCTDEQILNAGSAVRDSGGLKYLQATDCDRGVLGCFRLREWCVGAFLEVRVVL